MTIIHARLALLPDGWAPDVRVALDNGLVEAIRPNCPPGADDERCATLVPGMPNLHSHAFQRGMAGLTERRGPADDTFWTWREAMYRFGLAMNPDQLEAVSAQAYVEMLEAGFTRVGEFHYLHHDRDGTPYADPAEMAQRIASAAARTGIRLTLLPVFYAHAGFGGTKPLPVQRRFINDLDGYVRLLEGSRRAIAGLDGAVLGIAPHSLRAVAPAELAALLDLAPSGPVHMHIAEQQREIADCLAWSGQRPVEWLLDQAPVDGRWCLVHSTHMTGAEVVAVARSGAVAGICPVTEANLGDGIFPAPAFVAAAGRYGVGTDSNVRIGIVDELRQLEYSQRLRDRSRNVMVSGGCSTGRSLVESSLAGGQQALGAPAHGIAVGAPADLVALAAEPWLGEDGDTLLDRWNFARGVEVAGVWVAGRKAVHDGRHVDRDDVAARYRSAMRDMLGDAPAASTP